MIERMVNVMKKLILLTAVVLLCGCSSVNKSEVSLLDQKIEFGKMTMADLEKIGFENEGCDDYDQVYTHAGKVKASFLCHLKKDQLMIDASITVGANEKSNDEIAIIGDEINRIDEGIVYQMEISGEFENLMIKGETIGEMKKEEIYEAFDGKDFNLTCEFQLEVNDYRIWFDNDNKVEKVLVKLIE